MSSMLTVKLYFREVDPPCWKPVSGENSQLGELPLTQRELKSEKLIGFKKPEQKCNYGSRFPAAANRKHMEAVSCTANNTRMFSVGSGALDKTYFKSTR